MFARTRLISVALVIGALTLAACSSQPATSVPAQASHAGQSQTQPTLPAVNNGEGGGEAGGVEAALVTYSDATQGFSIGHPGPWTQDTSVTSGVKFVGGDDSLTLEFVTPAKGLSAMDYAMQDASLAALPGYKQLTMTESTEVKNAVVVGFEANGTSAVTGKSFTAHNERYYMPLSDSRLALLTLVGPANHYDREGVRDIALTLKVTK